MYPMHLEPHSAYSWSLSVNRGTAPGPERFREEDPTRPTVGDLIQAGQLVKTNYGTGPYRVEEVTRQEYFGRTAWGLVLSEVRDGVVKSNRDYYINEIVVQWEGDKPKFKRLFRASPDEVFLIDGSAFAVSRGGQLRLF